MSNPNWDRWIVATMQYNFDETFKNDFKTFVEGTHRGLPESETLLEFRIDGPHSREASRNNFVLEVEINILCRSMMDDTDLNRIRRMTGQVRDWLAQHHCIYRYGDGPDDDESLLGELHLKNRHKSELVRVNHFGQIDPKYRIEEATVEANFEIHLSE